MARVPQAVRGQFIAANSAARTDTGGSGAPPASSPSTVNGGSTSPLPSSPGTSSVIRAAKLHRGTITSPFGVGTRRQTRPASTKYMDVVSPCGALLPCEEPGEPVVSGPGGWSGGDPPR